MLLILFILLILLMLASSGVSGRERYDGQNAYREMLARDTKLGDAAARAVSSSSGTGVHSRWCSNRAAADRRDVRSSSPR